jgi:hypothetical protein
MLASSNRLPDEPGTQLRGGSIEKDFVLAIHQTGIKISADPFNAMRLGKCIKLRAIASHNNRVGHQPIAIGQRQPTFRADRRNGSNEVLVHAHTSRDAVHDDANAAFCHMSSPWQSFEQEIRQKIASFPI